MNLTLDFAWIEAVMLAGVRLIAFLVIAPPFSYNAFPLRVKGMLSLGLALAVSPVVTPGYVSPDTGGFILALLLEVVVGGMLGFLVLIVFSAVQSAGNLIDQFGGFQLAQGFDPQAMINGAMFTRLYQMTALALLFASGGYQLIIGGLTRSFTAIPIGGGMDLGGCRPRPAHPGRPGPQRVRPRLPAQDPDHPHPRGERLRRPSAHRIGARRHRGDHHARGEVDVRLRRKDRAGH